MNEAKFWDFIERTRHVTLASQAKGLVRLLKQLSEDEIRGFSDILAQKLADAYRHDLWAAAFIIRNGCSDDAFEYFRAWLISRGQKVFESALINPESLAEIADRDADGEELLSCATDAFHAITGKRLRQKSYEGSSPLGKAWKEDEIHLKKMFPILFEKFWNNKSTHHKQSNDVIGSIEQRAASGQPRALLTLGRWKVEGQMLSKDELQGVKLITQAVEKNYSEAYLYFAILLRDGIGIAADSAKHRDYLLKAALLNAEQALNFEPPPPNFLKNFNEINRYRSIAYFLLGVSYELGIGTQQNLPLAIKFYEGAHNCCVSEATCRLGMHTVEKHQPIENALQWYKTSPSVGVNRYRIARLTLQNGEHKSGIKMLQEAAYFGDPLAMFELAGAFEHRLWNIPKSLPKAYIWYKRSANLGYHRSQDYLHHFKKLVTAQHIQKAEELESQIPSGKLSNLNGVFSYWPNYLGDFFLLPNEEPLVTIATQS